MRRRRGIKKRIRGQNKKRCRKHQRAERGSEALQKRESEGRIRADNSRAGSKGHRPSAKQAEYEQKMGIRQEASRS
jgi:hypothetical protein